MKKMIMIMAAACAIFAHGATKVATQDWVRKLVNGQLKTQLPAVTNVANNTISYTATISETSSLTECLPRGSTITFTTTQHTNVIYQAIESTVDGVPVGTEWRLMGKFLNSANSVLPQMRFRLWLDIGATTNYTWKIYGSNVVTHTEYASFHEGTKWVLIDTTDTKKRIKLSSMRVSDARANSVYMADIIRSRWHERLFANFFSLLIPSANAAWIDDDGSVIPQNPMDYEVSDYDWDAETLDTRYLTDVTITIKDENGKPVTITVVVPDGGDDFNPYGSFQGDVSDIDANGKLVPKSEFFASDNWNLPFTPDNLRPDNANFDRLIFVDENGEEHTIRRSSLEKSEEWTNFIMDINDAYLRKLAALNMNHTCVADPENNCKCIFYDSIHCSRGRGNNRSAQARWSDEDVCNSAIEMHKMKKVGKCEYCENECGKSNHPENENSCTCDCGEKTKHVHRSYMCRCLCGASYKHVQTSQASCFCQCDKKIKMTHHRASDSECRCECGDILISHVFNGNCRCQCQIEPNPGGHQFNGNCRCQCGEKTDHKCTAHCYCHNCNEFIAHNYLVNPCVCECGFDDEHDFEDDKCECKCGEEHKHKKASDDVCKCRCGETTPNGHIPVEGQCACQCGDTTPNGHIRVTGDCWCQCRKETPEGHIEKNPCRCLCGDHTDHVPSLGLDCKCACGESEIHKTLHGHCWCNCGKECVSHYIPTACDVCQCGKHNTHIFDDSAEDCVTCACGEQIKHYFREGYCYCRCGTKEGDHQKIDDEHCKCQCTEHCFGHFFPRDTCRCQCGDKLNPEGHYYFSDDDCYCECTEQELHKHPIDLCHCTCGETDEHVEIEGECKCDCGDTTPKGHIHNSNECACQCGDDFVHVYTDSICLCQCREDNEHDAVEGQCKCKCGETVPNGHVAKNDCECQCGEEVHHVTDEGKCACHCGKQVVHVGINATKACYCECGQSHIGFHSSGCQCCNICHGTMAGGDATDESLHSLKSGDACECCCGMYNSENKATSIALHKFSDDEVVDGYMKCTCVCGDKHAYREPTTYHVNLHERCPGVCAYCKDKKADGEDASASDHTKNEHSDAHCGCWCGKYDHTTEDTSFHIQMINSCRCYGSEGNGGTYHFKCPRDGCPKVCQYEVDGELHLAAKDDVEEWDAEEATYKDHKKCKTACGCECEWYCKVKNNIPDDMHANNPNTCLCYCDKKHHSTYMSACPKICDKCGKACSNGGDCLNFERWNPEDSDHVLHETLCGCKCGRMEDRTGMRNNPNKYHHQSGGIGLECWCNCQQKHINADTHYMCNYCDTCNWDLGNDKDSRRNDRNSLKHTLKPETCDCDCGQWKNGSLFAHVKRPDNSDPVEDRCSCWCGLKTFEHTFVEIDRVKEGTHTCEYCQQEITDYRVFYNCYYCERSADESATIQNGHAVDCGLKRAEENPICACGCLLWCCDSCTDHSGICEACGGACGSVSSDSDGGGGDVPSGGGGGSAPLDI